MKVEDEYTDVLQNIEFGIIQVSRADRSLLDLDAKDAVAGLIRHYRAEQAQHTPPELRLGERRSGYSTVCCLSASGAWGVNAPRCRRSWDLGQRSRTRSMRSAPV